MGVRRDLKVQGSEDICSSADQGVVNSRGPRQELTLKMHAHCVLFPVGSSGRRGCFGLQLVKFSIRIVYFLWVVAKRSRDKSQMFSLCAMLMFLTHPYGKENTAAWRTI